MSKVNDLSAYSSDQSSDTPANTEYMQSTKEKRALRIMPRIMHGHSFLPLSISLCCRGEVVVDDSPPRLFSLSRNGRFKLYASSSNPPNRSTRDAVPPLVTRAIAFLSIPGNGLSLLVSRKRENGKKQAATGEGGKGRIGRGGARP